MSSKKYIPYTYLIGWSHLNKWYYGSEYGNITKIAHPTNLWTTYFTSSSYVESFRKTNGEPDVIQIRKTFSTMNETRMWESKVLKRMNVVKNDNWLNKFDGIGIDPFAKKDIKHIKGANTRKGKKYPAISKAKKGQPNKKQSELRKGKVACIDSKGNKLIVTKEEFISRNDLVGVKRNKSPSDDIKKQTSETIKRKYMLGEIKKHVFSFEEKLNLSNKRKGKVSCVDLTGNCIVVSTEHFKSNNELVGIRSVEGQRRIFEKNSLS
jgi:hypothetical protein